MLIARFILGSIALAAIWLAAWPMHASKPEQIILAVVFSCSVSAFASWLSLQKNKQRKIAPLVFAAPFSIFSLGFIPSLLESNSRPFVFWTLTSLAALIVSFFSDALVFRRIVEDEENT